MKNIKTFNNAKFLIKGVVTNEQIRYCAPKVIMELRVGDEIEISWTDIGEIAEYTVTKVEEKWERNDVTKDETNWRIYTIRYIPNSRKDL